MPPFGFEGGGLSSLLPLLQRFLGLADSVSPNVSNLLGITRLIPRERPNSPFPFPVKILTLKQFRDAHDTESACYQAIVQSTISIDGIVDGGLLFNPQMGDPTGGIFIDVRDDDSQSLVKDLGIEVSERIGIGDAAISRLRPIVPFWSELDLSYGPADFQCWRSLASTWSTSNDPTLLDGDLGQINSLTPEKDTPPKALPNLTLRKDDSAQDASISYVTLGSGAREEIGGTISSSDVVIRFLPLKVKDPDGLQTIICKYMDNAFFNFKLADQQADDGAASNYVFFTITDFTIDGLRDSEGRPFYGTELSFQVVVDISSRDNQAVPPPTRALLPLFTFAGEDWEAATEEEIYGRFTLKSEIATPRRAWKHAVYHLAPGDSDDLLAVKTLLFPNVFQGQELTPVKLLKILKTGQPLSDTFDKKDLSKLALDKILSGDRNKFFYRLARKQIFDAVDPELCRADHNSWSWSRS